MYDEERPSVLKCKAKATGKKSVKNDFGDKPWPACPWPLPFPTWPKVLVQESDYAEWGGRARNLWNIISKCVEIAVTLRGGGLGERFFGTSLQASIRTDSVNPMPIHLLRRGSDDIQSLPRNWRA